jgi:hypothetical protein
MGSVAVQLYPPTWQRLMISGFFGGISVGLMVAAVVDGGWTGLAAAAGAAASLASAVRTMMLRVEVHPEHVVLVNWLRVVRLPWSEIERFGHDDEGLWVRRVNGREFYASAFHHGNGAWGYARRESAAAAARLEKIRRRRRRR